MFIRAPFLPMRLSIRELYDTHESRVLKIISRNDPLQLPAYLISHYPASPTTFEKPPQIRPSAAESLQFSSGGTPTGIGGSPKLGCGWPCGGILSFVTVAVLTFDSQNQLSALQQAQKRYLYLVR